MNYSSRKISLALVICTGALFAAQPVPEVGKSAQRADVVTELQQRIAKQSGDATITSEVAAALQSLRPESGKGYAVLDTTSFFPDDVVNRYYEAIYEHSRLNGPTAQLQELGLDSNMVIVPSPEQMVPMHDYVNWLTRMVNQAMRPDEQVDPASVELRITATDDKEWRFEQWHVDDLYMVASVTLIGEGTEFLPGGTKVNRATFASHKQEFDARTDINRVTRGRLLIFSGEDRGAAFPGVRPTVHRAEATSHKCIRLTMRFIRKGAVTLKLPSVPLNLLPAQSAN